MLPDDESTDDESTDDESTDDEAPLTNKRRPQDEEPQGRQWATIDLVASLLVGLVIGFPIAFKWNDWTDDGSTVDTAAQEPAGASSAAGPSSAAATTATAAASTDAFGRSPGEEHYGHTHK